MISVLIGNPQLLVGSLDARVVLPEFAYQFSLVPFVYTVGAGSGPVMPHGGPDGLPERYRRPQDGGQRP
ncbi:hypothetical protein [Deinococcus sp.]|uniref:hypothetical protein n=1 Tax=Deinococcus sp. TaxID=47478 RepID=UPI0028699A6D|nr:hypothetical protein [Deinococcus sp.]